MSVTIFTQMLALALTAANPTVAAIVANALAADADQFAEQKPVPPLQDRVIDVPFGDGNATGPAAFVDAFYTYEDGVLTLAVSFDRKSNVLDNPPIREHLTYWSEAQIFSSLTPIGKFVGRNAYGVSARVQQYRLSTIAVAFDRSSDPRSTRSTLKFELSAGEAKALAAAARLEFELASPAALSGHHSCTYLRSDATVDDPEEVSHLSCVVDAEVLRIRIVDSRDGKVLGDVFAPAT